jgi:hypothetical protein
MVLTLRKSFDLVGSCVLIPHLSIFLHAAEAIQSPSVIEEAKTHVEFSFSKLWKSLPLVLCNDVAFAASGCFVLTDAATRDKDLGEVWIHSATE